MSAKALSPVELVIEHFGGKLADAAKGLGIENQSVVWNWQKRGQVPADKVLAVEDATGISRHVLRPDIFGPAPQERASA